LTTMSEPSWSHDRQKWLHREKTENRRDNRYTEVVKDPDTGEIVHEVDGPLTDHRGHGSARRKKDPPESDYSPNCLEGSVLRSTMHSPGPTPIALSALAAGDYHILLA
jgi:hypothetical protein